MSVIPVLYAFAALRTVIGLAPIVAAGPLVGLLGFPPGEDTATARVFARLFGVRDVGLGAMIAWSADHPDAWLPMIGLNLCTDLGDLCSFAAGVRGRRDLRRPFGASAAVAGSAVIAWAALGICVSA